MALNCGHCQAGYEPSDAFCRKCGAVLSAESLALVEQSEISPRVVEGQVVELGASTEKERKDIMANPAVKTVVKVGSKLGETLFRAMQTETGKKLTQSATTLAVTIGTELATRAVKNMVAPEKGKQSSNTPGQSLANQILQAMQDSGQPEPNKVQEEVVIIERFYRRRVYRRNQE